MIRLILIFLTFCLATVAAGAQQQTIVIAPGEARLVDIFENSSGEENKLVTIDSVSGVVAEILKNEKQVVILANSDITVVLEALIRYQYTSDGATQSGQLTVRVDPTRVFPSTSDQLEVVGSQLLLLLVLAILLEQGLAVLFNWRWYRRYFDGRGLKLPIAFLAALFFVNGFNINAVYSIIEAFEPNQLPSTTWPGYLLTALIVAGGSSLVFQLFEIFGLRTPIRNRKEVDRLRQLARFRVSVERTDASEGRAILVSVAPKAEEGKDSEAIVVGSLQEDDDKAPASPLPGFELTPGHHIIELSYIDATTGEVVPERREITAGPGANIALDFKL